MANKFIFKAVVTTAAAALVLTGCSSQTTASGDDSVNTLKEGVLTVGITPYMPYTSDEDGKCVGLDCEILNEVADRLDMAVETSLSDWAGMLTSAQTNRIDIAIGSITWTKERTTSARFTDDVYYSPPAIGGHAGESYQTLDDLEGKKLGAVVGNSWMDAFPEIDGLEVSMFPQVSDMIAAYAAGHVDLILTDPMAMAYTVEQRPEMDLEVYYLEAPTDEQVAERPGLKAFQLTLTAFYTADESVEKAVTKEIREMYADGTMQKIFEKNGVEPEKFLEGSEELMENRIGVDREPGWTPPAMETKE